MSAVHLYLFGKLTPLQPGRLLMKTQAKQVFGATRNLSLCSINQRGTCKNTNEKLKINNEFMSKSTVLSNVQFVNNFEQRRNANTDIRGTSKRALELFKELEHLKSSPAPALVYGLSGLLPFVAPPLFMAMSGTYAAGMAFGQVAYGACILSFLGGVRWGITIPDESQLRATWFNLGYSVTPALVGGLALLLPVPLGLVTLMAGLGGSAYMDLTMFGYPSWFKALRFVLSVGAILALWTTLVCRFILSDEKKPKKKKEVKQVEESYVAPSPKPEPVLEPVTLVQALPPVPLEKPKQETLASKEGSTDKPELVSMWKGNSKPDLGEENIKELKD